MLADIEAGKVNMVITKDLSRLGRDRIGVGQYIEFYFPQKRVRYIALAEGVDSGVESSANDMAPMVATMNDLYARDTSKKIRAVKHRKQHNGEFIGGKPMYGYRMHPTQKNKIVIDEEVAPIVRRIFAMAEAGTSCRRIAMQLNEEKISTPAVYANLKVGKPGHNNGKWSQQRISEMLRNETYIGNMVQGRSVKISYKLKQSQKQPPEKWIVVEGTHEPLVDKETFARVQQMLKSRRYTRSRTYDFLLKGLIFCHECGSPLGVRNRHTAAGEDRLYLECRNYLRFTTGGDCSCHSIREQLVTQAVTEKVREVCQAYLDGETLHKTAVEAVKKVDEKNRREEEVKRLRGRIDGMTVNLDRMYIDRLNGLLSEKDFERIYQKTCAERNALENRLKELEAQQGDSVGAEERAKELVQRFLETAHTSRELLVSLVERVELTKEKKIIIKFRFPELEIGF